jgi:prepilin-type N-terminal cleavage/methylation domain-containing protein
MKHINHKGFSLLEILLTITLLAILFTILVNSIQPRNIVLRSEDRKIEADALTIYQALEQYALKNNAYPEAIKNMPNDSSAYICKTSSPNCTNFNQINLSTDILVPIYLSKIPEYSTDTNNSGFYVVKDSNGKIGIGGVRRLNDTTFVKGLEKQNFENIVTDGLVLYLDTGYKNSYPDTGNTWFDLSGGSRHFTGNAIFIDSINGIRSGATWTSPASSVGNILNTDYHSIFFTIKFNSTTTFPEGWTGAWNKIFEHNGSSGDRSPGIWRYPSNRIIHWRYNPGNTGADFGQTGSSGNFSLNSWFIVGVTKDGATTRSYVNGTQVSMSSVSFPKQTGSSNINLLPGYPSDIINMNNVMIYDRALSSSEIQQNFNAIRERFGL